MPPYENLKGKNTPEGAALPEPNLKLVKSGAGAAVRGEYLAGREAARLDSLTALDEALSKFKPGHEYSLDKKTLISKGELGLMVARDRAKEIETSRKEHLDGRLEKRSEWMNERERLRDEKRKVGDEVNRLKWESQRAEREAKKQEIKALDKKIEEIANLLKKDEELLTKFNKATEDAKRVVAEVEKSIPVAPKEKRVALVKEYNEIKESKYKEEIEKQRMAERKGETFQSTGTYLSQLMRKEVKTEADVAVAKGMISAVKNVVEKEVAESNGDSFAQLRAVKGLAQTVSMKAQGATWKEATDPNSTVSKYSKEALDAIEKIARMNDGKNYHEVVGMATQILNTGDASSISRTNPVSPIVVKALQKFAGRSDGAEALPEAGEKLSPADTVNAANLALVRARGQFDEGLIKKDEQIIKEMAARMKKEVHESIVKGYSSLDSGKMSNDEKFQVTELMRHERELGQKRIDDAVSRETRKLPTPDDLKAAKAQVETDMLKVADKVVQAPDDESAKAELKSLIALTVREGVSPSGGQVEMESQRRNDTLAIVYDLSTLPKDPEIIREAITECERARATKMIQFYALDHDRPLPDGAGFAAPVRLNHVGQDTLNRVLEGTLRDAGVLKSDETIDSLKKEIARDPLKAEERFASGGTKSFFGRDLHAATIFAVSDKLKEYGPGVAAGYIRQDGRELIRLPDPMTGEMKEWHKGNIANYFEELGEIDKRIIAKERKLTAWAQTEVTDKMNAFRKDMDIMIDDLYRALGEIESGATPGPSRFKGARPAASSPRIEA